MKNPFDTRTLLAAYRVPGFRTQARVDGCEENPRAFVITLARRQKKRCAAVAGKAIAAFMTGAGAVPAISIAATAKSISTSRCAAWTARPAAA
jgi:hypothetical protein